MAGKSTGNLLPPDFKDLEKFAEDWAIPHEADRYRFRASRSIEELQELYDAVLPRLDAISDHIDQYSLDDIPIEAARLLWLANMFMEVTPSVEVYGTPDVPNSIAFEKFFVISPDHPITVRQ
ncbi:MAG: hypothetical protein RIE22_01895 [Alphaproteobacteria bacterium]